MKKIASIVLASLMTFAIAATVIAAEADTKLPSDVENLKASALDSAVKLTWDAATDDTGVDGYQVHYGTSTVDEKGKKYDKMEDVGDKTEYTVSKLENGTKYYFSIIAYDEAKNESLAWAKEQSATPVKGSGESDDKDAPTVSKAEAINKEQVKITFSEEIVLPKEDPEDAFAIENNDDFEPLVVLAAEMDEEDKDNKTVIITTAAQVKNVEYKLTVSIDIEDKAGNPVISGTSDTALFDGSDVEKEPEDTEGPVLNKVEVLDSTHIGLTFSETIVLDTDPSSNFQINQQKDQTKQLDVLGVKLGDSGDDIADSYVILTTTEHEGIKYVVMAVNVEDEAGNTMNAGKNSAEFEGEKEAAEEEPPEDADEDDDQGSETPPDTTAPKDVANFLADAVVSASKYVVTLNWDIPEDLKDSIEQNLYLSKDKGAKYDSLSKIGPAVDEYDIKDMEPGEYWVKLTQKDAAGNESEGTVIEVILSETGPGTVGLILASLGLGRVYSKKRRKR
ncbi:MAG: fibronectin type III domain-containing protein [bacterium]|nr:fibronectin type III domain-containing protein [bacterium]